jgi:Xaa-Pro aminopeptidase
VYEHLPPQATEPRAAKLARVREAMARHGATHHFVSTVDDIAWITNLRGSDVEYNPVFLAHLLIDLTRATLFVGAGKVDAALAAELAADGVRWRPTRRPPPRWPRCPAAPCCSTPSASPTAAPACVPAGVRGGRGHQPQHAGQEPQDRRRGRAFVREAMAEDGAAMCEFYAWFEAALARGERITELTIDERLSAERARRRASWA